jgi:hypothetical protein
MKSLFEQFGGTYHREGDYLIPDLVAPESPNIGIWGQRRKNYLKKSRSGIYTGLLLSGELNAHLEEADRTASEMVDRLITEMAAQEGITEQLKASDQMAWVGAMNNIRNRAEEIVLREVVYA